MPTAARDPATLTFAGDGAQLFPGAVVGELGRLCAATDRLAARPGVRLTNVGNLLPSLAAGGSIGAVAVTLLGSASRPVRAVLFDKTVANNWSLGWHQDRTICVERRITTDGFGPWTIKAGQHHVVPPFDLLTRMITVRVHLDAVDADNATAYHRLRFAPPRSCPGRGHRRHRRAVSHSCLPRRGGRRLGLLDATPSCLVSRCLGRAASGPAD